MNDDALQLKVKCAPSIDRICYIVTLPENVGRPDRVEAAVEELLLVFAKQQRAAGLQEAIDICNNHHAKDHWYITRIKGKCEARAKELESPLITNKEC